MLNEYLHWWNRGRWVEEKRERGPRLGNGDRLVEGDRRDLYGIQTRVRTGKSSVSRKSWSLERRRPPL